LKPAPFEYHAPSELAEALDLLACLENARPLAGGQSLIPMMNFRLVAPEHLVDLNTVAGLAGIVEQAETVRIGAMTRQRALERSSVVANVCPLLAAAVAHIGHQQTRNRGTLGGSLCHLDPGAELPVAASALDASLIAVSPKGTRALSMDDFAIDYLTNGLEPGELLLAIEFQKCKPWSGVAFEEFSRRPADLAIVSAASVIELGPGGVIERAAIAIGGLGAGPTRLRDFERSCVGALLDEGVIRAASAAVRQQPAVGQGEYSADYRSHLAGVLCARSIRNAAQRSEREAAYA
jgi:aerobic carbon-monoxide dehydrogenase medium subunit